MIWGVLIGTYCSGGVAVPLLLRLGVERTPDDEQSTIEQTS